MQCTSSVGEPSATFRLESNDARLRFVDESRQSLAQFFRVVLRIESELLLHMLE